MEGGGGSLGGQAIALMLIIEYLYKKSRILFGFLLDLVFPESCVGCEELGVLLCDSCKKELGLQVTRTKLPDAPLLDKIIYIADFKKPLVARMVKQCKFRGVSGLGRVMGRLLKEQLGVELGKFHDFVIVPIPLHRKRLKMRGFNQSLVIARELGLTIESDWLRRSINTNPQAELDLVSRKKNVSGIFSLGKDFDINKYNKVILIDDVVTTGLTLNEAAKVLKEAGVREVVGVVFAHSFS